MASWSILFAIIAACFSFCRASNETTIEPKCVLDTAKMVEFRRSWMAIENSIDLDDNDKEIILNGTKDTELKLCNDGKGPMVSKRMAEYCTYIPHNCKLEDGSIYFYNATNDCYVKTDAEKYPWGISEIPDTPLRIYSSLSDKDIPLGTVLLVEELVDLPLYNSTVVHNGCVRVDHICNSCKFGCQKIRLYVGTYDNYKNYFPKFDHATVKKSDCKVLIYD